MNSIRPFALLVHAVLTAWPSGVIVLLGLVYPLLGIAFPAGFESLWLIGLLCHFVAAAMLLRDDMWRWRVALGAAVVALLNMTLQAPWAWHFILLEGAAVGVVVWGRPEW